VSVRPSAMNNSTPTGQIFMNFETWEFLKKSVEKIQVELISDKNNVCFTWRRVYVYDNISLNSSQNEICFRQNLCRKWKYIFCWITFSRKSCRLWDNVEKYGTAGQATDGNIIRRMRFACWITRATDTHSECVILIAFRRQQWLRERASVLRYTYIASLVYWWRVSWLKNKFLPHKIFNVFKIATLQTKSKKFLINDGRSKQGPLLSWNAMFCQLQ
jgi:hypothetical protein